MTFFEFPEDGRWSDERDAVEFSVILRPYEGTVRIPRRVFQGLLNQRPTPQVRVPVDCDHGFRWKMITESGGT